MWMQKGGGGHGDRMGTALRRRTFCPRRNHGSQLRTAAQPHSSQNNHNRRSCRRGEGGARLGEHALTLLPAERHRGVQGLLHQMLRLGIQSRGRLVGMRHAFGDLATHSFARSGIYRWCGHEAPRPATECVAQAPRPGQLRPVVSAERRVGASDESGRSVGTEDGDETA